MPNLIELFGQLTLFAKLTIPVALAAFGLAAAYAMHPTEQKLVLMRPVSLAALFTTMSGLFGGWCAVLASTGAASLTPDGHLPTATFYRGIGESLVVGFISFGLLGAGWILIAVGVVRRQRESAA